MKGFPGTEFVWDPDFLLFFFFAGAKMRPRY